MELPEDLRYSDKHEWVRLSGDLARVGITDYAQDALGDIVYVEVVDTGTELAYDQALGEVESTKSVSDVYAPVAGTVVEINESLGDAPELLNSDPYGDGWIAVIRLAEGADMGTLMSAAEYAALTEGE
ncbi:MAG: glycine cleavage system protein GcvH [Acidimicrobiales bacterium]